MKHNVLPGEKVEIREYDPACPWDAAAFRNLNEEWLERYFVIEPDDRTVLNDPFGQIIRPGGAVLMAVTASGQAVGCCALIPQRDERPLTYEIAKLAVTAAFQGRRIGRELMEASLALARRLGARRVVLVTNSGLEPARRLYESMGFTYLAQEKSGALAHYERGDTFMELSLDVERPASTQYGGDPA